MGKSQTNLVHLREQNSVQWMEIVSFLLLGKLKRIQYTYHSEGVFMSPMRVSSHDTSYLFMDLMFVSPKIHMLKPCAEP